ncbi:glycosyl hydrolase family 18 protein [Actinocatenispora comari]|uniref:glycosyl hydrolase family 18 protein n=1 Tax=Actinocatenispora comari TaxID=2807577 RepID=UPI001A913206|nr:glycosyl hydrolase family 18 protein [Actinocatenispora comari]
MTGPVRRWPPLAVVGLLLIGLLVGCGQDRPQWRHGVLAAVPYWNFGAARLDGHAGRIDTYSPWVYGIAADGTVVPQRPGADTAALRSRPPGTRYVPTVANALDGTFSYRPVSRVLHDPAARARHVRSLVALAEAPHVAGIDLDYEDLRAGDRAAFTALVRQVAAALHARDRTLSVDLFAKDTDAGYAPRNVAQDYRRLGRAVDQVRLMAYDYHWETSGPGPISPTPWVRRVLRYATATIGADKLVLGMSLSGYDWVGHRGTDRSVATLRRAATDRHVPVRWDATAQAPWYSYRDARGRRHEVWFENDRSVDAKLALARSAHLAGVFFWLNEGSADGAVWRAAAGGGD